MYLHVTAAILFLITEGVDVDQLLEEVVGGTSVAQSTQGEELVATIGNIVIKLEAVIGRRTVPTLALEAGMNAVVKDWSTQVMHFFPTEVILYA